MCMGLLHLFWQGLMFFLGTWIGSNDLIMGSVCVTDKIYETRAWQKWGKVRKGMKQDYGNNEPVILGNETLSEHAFCLWKLREGILQSIIDFWSFLSLPSRSWTTLVSLMSCCTLAQLSLTGASEIAFGNAEDEVTTAGVEEALLPLPQPPLPPQLAPVPNWLQEEARARNRVFLRVKWLQPAMKGTSCVRQVRFGSFRSQSVPPLCVLQRMAANRIVMQQVDANRVVMAAWMLQIATEWLSDCCNVLLPFLVMFATWCCKTRGNGRVKVAWCRGCMQ